MRPLEDDLPPFPMTAEVKQRIERNTERIVGAQSNHRDDGPHIWTREQQTGHLVCAWCGVCEGGCR